MIRSAWASLAVSMIIGTSDSPTQDPAQLHSIETGKHQIEDYQVRSQIAGQRQTGFAVMSNFSGESGALKVHLNPVRYPRIVFNYQYCAAHQ